jgi:GntR family transcriptional regulator
MSLSDKAEIYRLDRIRLSGGKPLALMTNYLPVDIGGQFSKEDIIQRPIMNLLENKLNLHLSQADQIIDATSADAWTALQLDIRLEAPLLRMVRMVRDVNGRMVNYVYILFRADRYAFRVCLKRSTINNKNDWNPE